MSLIEAVVAVSPHRSASLIERAAARDHSPPRMPSPGGTAAPKRLAPTPIPTYEPAAFTPDWRRLQKLGLLTPGTRRTRLAEEVRLIKRQLLRRLDPTPPRMAADSSVASRVVLVTSARPHEGKSFTAVNLALSLAIDEGMPVTLVDGDVLRPSIHATIGMPRGPGLTDLLRDPQLAPNTVLRRISALPLSLLVDGSPVPSATELFGGVAMARLLQKLARARNPGIVVIDTPPLLSSTESVVLAPHADAVLIVVEAGRTSADAVAAALELLPDSNNVSLILNKCSIAAGLEQFGSYYSGAAPHDPPEGSAG